MTRIARGAASTGAAQWVGGVQIGDPLPIDPSSWSRPTSVLYTLLRDGVPVGDRKDMSLAELTATTFRAADIGPELVVRARALAGGTHADSLPTVFDIDAMFPLHAFWSHTDGITYSTPPDPEGGYGKVSAWASYGGGISCVLSQADDGLRPFYGTVGVEPGVYVAGGNHLAGTFTKGSAFDDVDMGATINQESDEGTGATFFDYVESSNDRFYLNESSGVGVLRGSIHSGYSVTASGINFIGTPRHLAMTGDLVGGPGSIRVGADVIETASVVVASRGDGGTLYVGIRGASLTFPSASRLLALHFGPKMSLTQQEHALALHQYMTGVG